METFEKITTTISDASNSAINTYKYSIDIAMYRKSLMYFNGWDQMRHILLSFVVFFCTTIPCAIAVAPAGYGKSLLVSCWVKAQDWPNVWISLDKNDNDFRRFVIYFITAVQKLFPTALEDALRLMDSGSLPPMQQLAGRLSTELGSIDRDFILVLDNQYTD